MSPELSHSLEKKWFSSLPASRMAYPDTLANRLKYAFWRFYTPCHPYVRDAVISLGIVRHVGRQNFILGTVAPHLTLKEFTSFLISQGYGNHFVAWEDEGEIVSLRYVKDFTHQYHLRVFKDREVRAHYEYTPECYPILHLKEKHFEPRSEEFLMLLGDTIVPHQGIKNQ
ncbi:MAG: hypothetical protein A3C06_01040 [Candidatus Taylorbacteria bacterium RIFCSPHIGHO2_02_FULL_46_13]|uniref:Uncharacterized protein n=1 Tax=Candidatus Taylorbacteria bacterium RIFCSPHIGHO2_02_FULL_46_13 TaxID=1802312 RepID=A0A1G2MT80_9BACT|nr:MAG: hypothetical protein A3C06_01040 [Candidatus Taylorbacteria bacterium RIFCSPHIGHO2_02_FULL_46_13]